MSRASSFSHEAASHEAAAEAPGPAERTRGSKADLVYERLKGAILVGDLAPGSAIDKTALCARLGVSRFPVSAALSRLAFEKLVVIAPQHGSFVSRIALSEMREFMLIRRALEGDIAAEAARASSLGAKLDRSLRYQAAAVAARDGAGFYHLDVEFHRLIVASLGFNHAADMLDQLQSHLERVRRLGVTPEGRMEQTLREHGRIAEAITERDATAAQAATRAHIDSAAAMFEIFAQNHPQLFAETAFDA